MARASTLCLLAALIGCGAGCGGGGGAGDGGPGGDAAPRVDGSTGELATIHFIGRFDGSEAGPRFSWPGSAIAARFEGAGIAVGLDDAGGNHFDVSIDGEAQPVLVTTSGAADYPLASGLGAGQHEVVITRRTESFFGLTGFLGFSGATLIESEGPTRWIEMIGDSITCGYGVLGVGPSCPFTADTEAETHAWGALAAAEFGAAHAAIAYSGKGVYRNYGGDTSATMPELFTRTFAEDPSSTWGFDGYTPAVVVIDLGTNDFSTGDPGSSFVTAYADFVAAIRTHYPDAFVVVAHSPMLSDSYPAGEQHRTLAAQYFQQVVDGAGSRVSYLDIAEQSPDDGYGCDYHPSEATQQIMAAALVAHVRSLTGWN